MKMDATQHDDFLMHYGIKRRSGRYPWGSGRDPLQRSKRFIDIMDQHAKDGMSPTEIAKAYDDAKNGFPFTTADLRQTRAIAVNEIKSDQIRQVQKLTDKGMGASAIARELSTPEKRVSESTVRSLQEPGRLDKLAVLNNTADMLRRQVDEKKFLDVGSAVEKELPIFGESAPPVPISPDKFKTALSMLKEEGYSVHPLTITQVSNGELTRYQILVPPGVSKKDVFDNRDKIRLISEKTDDRGHTYTDFGIQPPLSIHPNRVGVRYKEDGGADADGVIYVRPGVKDIELGKSTYAQVRIQIGDGHYLKGMAVYKDDLPKGVDLLFNTNKSTTGNKLDALKELKHDEHGNVDKDNPFGAVIKKDGQILDPKTKKVTSAMNIVNEEGDWNTWSRTISSQMLSKQSPDLAKAQLDWTYEKRLDEYAKIKALTNPQVRKKLLESFADETDSAAVHLHAANMPRQATKVLLPSTHVKENEVFAPTFHNGERVALIRYPHAGTFEIPQLTVNNNNRAARELMRLGKGGSAPDAIVIHPMVAKRLSGADFDGDAVVVIPNKRGEIKSTPSLEGLKGFDHQTMYAPYHGMKTIDGGTYNAETRRVDYGRNPDGTERKPEGSKKQKEMGKVTNLISDMTIRGAGPDELAAAVRHSMVVIDSEKHHLDWKASERDNGIIALKKRYQGVQKTGQPAGASTLLTRATAEARVDKRDPAKAGPGRTRGSHGTYDNRTGQKLYDYTGQHTVTYTVQDGQKTKKIRKSFSSKAEAEKFVAEQQPQGKITARQTVSTKLAETTNAHTLVSKDGGTRIEKIYADHSNRLKALANEARLEFIHTENIPYRPSSAKVYANEVKSLNAKLAIAEKNAPLERQAQLVARHIIEQRKAANPDMDPEQLRKIKGQALNEARMRTGARKTRLGSEKSPITDREWEAIQSGAISNHKLEKILRNANLDAIKERATPRDHPVMSSSMTSFGRQLLAKGYTIEEVADRLGVPQSTLTSSIEAAKKGGG